MKTTLIQKWDDISRQWFYIYVKLEFVKICPNWNRYSFYQLSTDWNLGDFLHNEDGPAMINFLTGAVEYYINGEYLPYNSQKFMDKF